METFNKLVGVQDAYRHDDDSLPSQPVASNTTHNNDLPQAPPQPPPIPKDDIPFPAETGAAQQLSSRAARAPLPLNRKASHKSIRSQKSVRSHKGSLAGGQSIPPTPTLTQSFRDAHATPRTPGTPTFPQHFASATQEDERESAIRREQQQQQQQTVNVAPPSSSSPQITRSESSSRQERRDVLSHTPLAEQQSQLQPQPDARVGDEEEEEEENGDFTWGPTHPCFPHPNPHCAPRSAEHAATRVIRVRRDYLLSADLYPAYANLYPEILEPFVTDAEFRFLIAQVNTLCRAALAPGTAAAWTDALLGMFTGYLWDDLGYTQARRGHKALERFLDRWNAERAQEGKDVRVVQLRRTGFMNLDFVIPDPGIDAVDEEEAEEELRA